MMYNFRYSNQIEWIPYTTILLLLQKRINTHVNCILARINSLLLILLHTLDLRSLFWLPGSNSVAKLSLMNIYSVCNSIDQWLSHFNWSICYFLSALTTQMIRECKHNDLKQYNEETQNQIIVLGRKFLSRWSQKLILNFQPDTFLGKEVGNMKI